MRLRVKLENYFFHVNAGVGERALLCAARGKRETVGKIERELRALVAGRKRLRQLQRSCVNQPKVGAQRLPWVNVRK